MDGFDRLYDLHGILAKRRGPISTRDLMARLECSRPTLHRTGQHLRDFLGAPIRNKPGEGYYYEEDAKEAEFTLPGLWFSAEELRSLLVMRQLLDSIEPGILGAHLQPFLSRIEQLLDRASPGNAHFPADRVRVLQAQSRVPKDVWFRDLTNALVERRRVYIRYKGRTRNTTSERDISPQRLVYYRDNWYMDAWCHSAEVLRTFSLDRVEVVRTLDETAIEIPKVELDSHLATSYGIFAGEPRRTAHPRPH